jgi:hypothetical protein
MPRWGKIAIAVGLVLVFGLYGLSVYNLHHPDCPPKGQLNTRLALATPAQTTKILQCFAHYDLNPPIAGSAQSPHG